MREPTPEWKRAVGRVFWRLLAVVVALIGVAPYLLATDHEVPGWGAVLVAVGVMGLYARWAGGVPGGPQRERRAQVNGPVNGKSLAKNYGALGWRIPRQAVRVPTVLSRAILRE